MRIAVWSGPRNLSTALLYSFSNRADVTGLDEPFYGAYLQQSGSDHPLAAETMESMECDPERVVPKLQTFDTPYQYEKHMVHHMLPGFPLNWMTEVRNVFLIRHPARVVASYLRKREVPTAEDLGFTQMDALFALVPDAIVIDSSDICADPRRALTALCNALGIPFDPAMLSWPAGPKPCDGAWAPHWYDAVHRSTGFDASEGLLPEVPCAYRPMMDDAVGSYERFKRLAL